MRSMSTDALTSIKSACCKHNSSVNHIQARDLSLVASGLMIARRVNQSLPFCRLYEVTANDGVLSGKTGVA
jgi:hypothetical protein